jgi:hypothetical protein
MMGMRTSLSAKARRSTSKPNSSTYYGPSRY